MAVKKHHAACSVCSVCAVPCATRPTLISWQPLIKICNRSCKCTHGHVLPPSALGIQTSSYGRGLRGLCAGAPAKALPRLEGMRGIGWWPLPPKSRFKLDGEAGC